MGGRICNATEKQGKATDNHIANETHTHTKKKIKKNKKKTRYWVVAWDCLYYSNKKNRDWKKLINPTDKELLETSFYIKYRSTLGNYKFMFWVYAAFWAVCEIILMYVMYCTLCLCLILFFFF